MQQSNQEKQMQKKISYAVFNRHLPPSLVAILDSLNEPPRILIYRSGRLVASVSLKNGRARVYARGGPGEARLREALATAVRQAQAASEASQPTTDPNAPAIDGTR